MSADSTTTARPALAADVELQDSARGRPASPQPSSHASDLNGDSKRSSPPEATSWSARTRFFIRGPPPGHVAGPPPDGGFQAWLQVFCAHLISANTWGFLTAFGAFQTYFSNEYLQGTSQSDIAWIGSFEIFMLLLLGAVTGRALDAGWFRPVYFAGGVIFTLGTFSLSGATTYAEIFLAQAVAVGIGSGLLFIPAIGLVATWFDRWRTLAMAVVLCGTATGGMVWPAMVSQLLDRIGFPWTIRIIAFIMLLNFLFTLVFFRPRLPPRSSGPLIEWTAFKDKAFLLYVSAYWFFFFSLYFAFYYIGSYARNVVGLSYQDSINLLIILNGLGIPGRVVPALLSDKYFGPLNVIFPCALAAGILIFGWIGIKSANGLYALAVLYGFFANGVVGLWPGGISRLCPDITKTGSRIGMGFSCCSFAVLVGPPIAGALIGRDDGQYLYAQIWSGASLVVGVVLLVCARNAKVGFNLKAKV